MIQINREKLEAHYVTYTRTEKVLPDPGYLPRRAPGTGWSEQVIVKTVHHRDGNLTVVMVAAWKVEREDHDGQKVLVLKPGTRMDVWTHASYREQGFEPIVKDEQAAQVFDVTVQVKVTDKVGMDGAVLGLYLCNLLRNGPLEVVVLEDDVDCTERDEVYDD